MTTICYRDGVMAADTRISTSNDHIAPGRMIKIRRNGLALVGLSGDPGYWDALLAYLDGRAKIPEWGDDARALVASAAGIQTINKGPVFLAAPFAAIGSGQSAAWAAMHMGADARRAVEIAMLVDPFTGGEIDVLRLDGATGPILRSNYEDALQSFKASVQAIDAIPDRYLTSTLAETRGALRRAVEYLGTFTR